jgi:ABC-type lipoprotein export system ATPase subunit
MVRLEDVSKSYSSGEAVIRAVDSVSVDVNEGEFVIISGPSGSGKTTLLNLIGGMTRPDSGRISVGGNDIFAMSDAKLTRFRAGTIGFVFQFQSMLPSLSALDNVRLPLRFAGKEDDENAAMELLEKVGLEERESAFVHQLSSGQQRRVCIARALINQPSLLLCDEPTGDLDFYTEAAIMDMIRQANREGATVIMTTHNWALKSYGSQSLMMKAGKVSDNLK